MHTLVIGGSASGKSELAELLALKGPAPRYYIATMEVRDAESQRRVARHKTLRADKGFRTIERTVDLGGLRLPEPGGTALIECVTNLVAAFYGGMIASMKATDVTFLDFCNTFEIVVHHILISKSERHGI